MSPLNKVEIAELAQEQSSIISRATHATREPLSDRPFL